MNIRTSKLASGWIPAVLAVLLGCALLLLMGAPARMPVMNFAALLIGLVAARILRLADPRLADGAILGAALVLPATALLGAQADGVARWLVVAGVTVQPGLILVPLIAMGLAARPNRWRAAAVAVAALGTALQPDLGTAVMLVCGVAAAAVRTRSRAAAFAALLALAGAAAALARPVALPPVRFVEQVLPAALEAGFATGLLALSGVVAMFLPAVTARAGARSHAHAVFAAVWLGGLGAALIGPYPTPVIGFGGSAIFGYLLSVGMVTREPQATIAPAGQAPGETREEKDVSHLRLA